MVTFTEEDLDLPPTKRAWLVKIPELGHPAIEVEDGGMALIYQVDDGEAQGIFLRLQSWRDRAPLNKTPEMLALHHREFAAFAGRKVLITLEVVE